MLKQLALYAIARLAGPIIGKNLLDETSLTGKLFGNKQGQRRTAQQLLAAYGQMPWIRSVTGRISKDVASTPWQLFVKRDDDGQVEGDRIMRVGNFNQRQIRRRQLEDMGNIEEIESHPLLDLLDDMCPLLEGHSVFGVMQLFMELKGEGFLVIDREATKMSVLPAALWPIAPNWVEELPSTGNPYFKIDLFGKKRKIPAEDVIWLKDVDPVNPYGRGTGTAEAMSDELDTDEYAAKHTKSWFQNGARPEHVFIAKGLAKPELERFQDQFEDMHAGIWKSFRTFWWNRELEIKELSQKFTDMELVKLREFERDLIVQVYGVPPEVLGIVENSNRATITASQTLYATHVLVPRLEHWRNLLQNKLVTEFDSNLILDYVSPVPEDRDFIRETASAASYTRSRDEWRSLQGLPPDENSPDVYYVPAAMIPIPVDDALSVEDEGDLRPALPAASTKMLKAAAKHYKKTGVLSDEMMPSVRKKVLAMAQGPAVVVDRSTETTLKQIQSSYTVDRALREEDIVRLLDELQGETLYSELATNYELLITEWGNKVLSSLGIDILMNMVSPRIAEYIEDRGTTMIKGIVHETTRDALRKQLVEGVQAGEGTEKIASRIQGVFRQSRRYRARTIARTEVLSASNFSTWEAHKQSTVVQQREWISTQDDATRDDHVILDGTIVNLDELFVSPTTGATAMYPGDFGQAELDINCRCTTAGIVTQPRTADERAAVWRVFDKDLIPWERQFERASKRGFDRQQAEMLEALDRLSVPD